MYSGHITQVPSPYVSLSNTNCSTKWLIPEPLESVYFTVLIIPQFLRMMAVASKGSGGQQEFKMEKQLQVCMLMKTVQLKQKILVNKREWRTSEVMYLNRREDGLKCTSWGTCFRKVIGKAGYLAAAPGGWLVVLFQGYTSPLCLIDFFFWGKSDARTTVHSEDRGGDEGQEMWSVEQWLSEGCRCLFKPICWAPPQSSLVQ